MITLKDEELITFYEIPRIYNYEPSLCLIFFSYLIQLNNGIKSISKEKEENSNSNSNSNPKPIFFVLENKRILDIGLACFKKILEINSNNEFNDKTPENVSNIYENLIIVILNMINDLLNITQFFDSTKNREFIKDFLKREAVVKILD